MNGDSYGKAVRNESHGVPKNAIIEDDPFIYPLAGNLVQLLVAVGCELVTRYILEKKKETYGATLRILRVQMPET